MTMKKEIIQALIAHYNAGILKNEVLLKNYLENSAGIGEHPDVIEECIKIVDAIAAARDGRDIVTAIDWESSNEQ